MSKSAPTHRESIDPQAFYDEVARFNLSPLWLREGHPPHKRAVPWLWQWPVVREQMMRAAEVVSTENVERRGFGLANMGSGKTGDFARKPKLVFAEQPTLTRG